MGNYHLLFCTIMPRATVDVADVAHGSKCDGDHTLPGQRSLPTRLRMNM